MAFFVILLSILTLGIAFPTDIHAQTFTFPFWPFTRSSPVDQKVDKSLLDNLKTSTDTSGPGGKPRVEALVFLTRPVTKTRVTARERASRMNEKVEFVRELRENTEVIRKRVVTSSRRIIDEGHVVIKEQFFIDNVLFVMASAIGVEQLSKNSDVLAITPNYRVEIPKPIPSTVTPAAVEWNISKVEADKAWNQLGVTGAGVVVADLDTGVNWTHPALKASYRGWNGTSADHTYNWFDAISYQPAPYDDMTGKWHGTHTTGTIVGKEGDSNQIGVAPGAKWIAAKFLNSSGSGSTTDGLEAMEWLLAPRVPSGTIGDPTKAPDIVSNSWGMSIGCSNSFRTAIQNWRSAGIVPVFANGNAGPNVGTVKSPGDNPESIGVGATDNTDTIASFSSLGPSCAAFGNEIKPEVSAPGVSVRSSISTSGYGTLSGTSMAAPHVAGTAALMLSANPGLSVDQIENLLKTTALDLGATGPDNTYGAGRINAFKAVETVLGTPPIPTPPSGPVLTQDFENGLGSWTTTGLWHVETAGSPCAVVYQGIKSGYYGKSDTCNFNTGVTNSGELVSPVFTIPSSSSNVVVSFRGWYETETTGMSWDKRKLEIREAGTGSWTHVVQLSADVMRQWNFYSFFLNAYKGKTVQIRFFFDTGDSIANTYKGWYLDDVVVTELQGTPSPTPVPTTTPTPTPMPTPIPTPSPTPTTKPTPTPIACSPADINSDGVVNSLDDALLRADYFSTNPAKPKSDINKDGVVDLTDYSLLVSQFLMETGPCQ